MNTHTSVGLSGAIFKESSRGFIYPTMEWLKQAVSKLGLHDPPASTPMDVEEGRNPPKRALHTLETAVTPKMMEEGERTPMPQAADAAQGGDVTPVIGFHGGDVPVPDAVFAGEPVFLRVDLTKNTLYQKRMARKQRQQAVQREGLQQ